MAIQGMDDDAIVEKTRGEDLKRARRELNVFLNNETPSGFKEALGPNMISDIFQPLKYAEKTITDEDEFFDVSHLANLILSKEPETYSGIPDRFDDRFGVTVVEHPETYEKTIGESNFVEVYRPVDQVLEDFPKTLDDLIDIIEEGTLEDERAYNDARHELAHKTKALGHFREHYLINDDDDLMKDINNSLADYQDWMTNIIHVDNRRASLIGSETYDGFAITQDTIEQNLSEADNLRIDPNYGKVELAETGTLLALCYTERAIQDLKEVEEMLPEQEKTSKPSRNGSSERRFVEQKSGPEPSLEANLDLPGVTEAEQELYENAAMYIQEVAEIKDRDIEATPDFFRKVLNDIRDLEGKRPDRYLHKDAEHYSDVKASFQQVLNEQEQENGLLKNGHGQRRKLDEIATGTRYINQNAVTTDYQKREVLKE